MAQTAESELIVPTLTYLNSYPHGRTTAQIRKQLLKTFPLTQEDRAPSPTRSGEMKFEQIVRNLLRVHRNLEKKRLVTYEDGVYRITATGTAYLAENRPILRALEEQGFSRTQIRRQLENDFRGIVIEEGAAREVTTTQRKRSQRLRNLKIHEVREANGGRLPCQACTFEFERRYGELGRGFIHIHHQEPVSQMDCEIASNNDPLRGGFRVQF